MKKLCLILVLLSFVSIVPAYALKVINSNPNNRIISDRSSTSSDYYESYTESSSGCTQSVVNTNAENSGYQRVTYVKSYEKKKFENVYLPQLAKDMKTNFSKAPAKTNVYTPATYTQPDLYIEDTFRK